MSERLKSLSYSDLILKYESLWKYIRMVEEEIQLRDRERGDNTFPLFRERLLHNVNKTVTKTSPKKKSPPKKQTPPKKVASKVNKDNEESKNERQINSTMSVIKRVLDENDIVYKSNISKPELIKLVRENHLVNKCNSEALKEKEKKEKVKKLTK